MAIQNRRGNFVDFDPYKMLAGEFAYALDTEELYYCVSPGNVKRCATKEEVIEILETSQEAYDGLQQLLTELEDETVATGILNNISMLLSDVAINKSNIATNTQDIINLDTKTMSHLADYANFNSLISTKLGNFFAAVANGNTTLKYKDSSYNYGAYFVVGKHVTSNAGQYAGFVFTGSNTVHNIYKGSSTDITCTGGTIDCTSSLSTNWAIYRLC